MYQQSIKLHPHKPFQNCYSTKLRPHDFDDFTVCDNLGNEAEISESLTLIRSKCLQDREHQTERRQETSETTDWCITEQEVTASITSRGRQEEKVQLSLPLPQ